jgi:tetratricopeptide (TPR) repeat protein
MPGSIADIVGRRLRGLPSIETETLEQAAVLGREFNFDVLLEMTAAKDEDTLLDVIEDLLRARLLEEVDHPYEDRYRFAHNKIQEVLYARQSRRRLRRGHRAAGEAVEKVYAGRLDGVTEPLARHFVEAGDRRGLEYSLKAGDSARAVYANKEALGYYDRALTLAESLWERGPDSDLAEQVIALCSGTADVNVLVGEYQKAIENLTIVLDLLPETLLESDQRQQMAAATHRRLAGVYEEQGCYDEAMTELQAALVAAPDSEGGAQELALIHKSVGWVQIRQGDYREAIASCNRGLKVVPPEDDGAIADLYHTLGLVHQKLGEYDRSVGYFQRSLTLRERLDDQPGIAKICNSLATVSWLQGNHGQAIDYSQRSLGISEKIGHSTGVASLYNNLGLIYCERGDQDRAIGQYQQALELFERIGNHLGVTLVYGNPGEAYQGKGDLTRAVEYLQLALERSTEIGDREGVTYAHHLLAQIHLARGDLDQALNSGRRALEIADAIGARPYQAEAHLVLGRTRQERNQPDQARPHLGAARRIFADLGDAEKVAVAEAALRMANQAS